METILAEILPELWPNIIKCCKIPIIDVPNLKQLVSKINTDIELLWYSQHYSKELEIRYHCEHRKSEIHSCPDYNLFQCDICKSPNPHFRIGYELWCVNCMNDADRFAADELGTEILDTKLMKTYTYQESNNDEQIIGESFTHLRQS